MESKIKNNKYIFQTELINRIDGSVTCLDQSAW